MQRGGEDWGKGMGDGKRGRRTRWMGDGYTVNAGQYNSVIHALKIQKNLPFAHVSKKKREKKEKTHREGERDKTRTGEEAGRRSDE